MHNSMKFIATLLVAGLPGMATADMDHQNEIQDQGGHHAHATRPDGHAPIGVMGDHMHRAGEVMFSYRYMHMDMGGNRVGSNSISFEDTLAQFPVTPLRMSMDMHMFGAMYAPADAVTFMVMLPYVEKTMDHRTRMGGEFTTSTSGVGDVKLSALVRLIEIPGHQLHLNAGVSFPTGSIGERGAIPINPDAQLPYPMQIGSGTYDLMPGITYVGSTEALSWGAQAMAVIRLDHNSRGYQLGDKFQLTGWVAVPLADWVSVSGRVAYEHTGNISGADPELNPMLVPTADPLRQGGDRIDLAFGLNFLVPDGSLKGVRLAVEAVVPVYQKLDGPQMERDWGITAGIQKAF